MLNEILSKLLIGLELVGLGIGGKNSLKGANSAGMHFLSPALLFLPIWSKNMEQPIYDHKKINTGYNGQAEREKEPGSLIPSWNFYNSSEQLLPGS